MPYALTPHAPVSSPRFPISVAVCFSRGGTRENIVIQSQLVEISAVFGRVWMAKNGVLCLLPWDMKPLVSSTHRSGRYTAGRRRRPAVSLVRAPKRKGQPLPFSRLRPDRLSANGLIESLFRGVSLEVMIEARFSHDGARGNRVIQYQLPEISDVFFGGYGRLEEPF